MIKKYFKKVTGMLGNHYISEHSAQCAFFIILSFIPFVILLLTLIKYLGLEQETLYSLFKAILPNDINNKILDIIQEVYTKSIGTISISIIFIIWSSGKGFYALAKGLNSIYIENKKQNYFSLKIRSIICTIGFVLVIVLALVVLVFGNKINIFINEHYIKLAEFTNAILNYTKMIIFVMLIFIFTLIYKFVPKHKVKFKYQIPGAFFTAIGWGLISHLLSVYLERTSGFSVIYGSLTIVMLLFMWIYLCIYILLLGAIINKEIEKRQNKWKNE